MNKCAFDVGEKCSALTEKNCTGCRFRKTEEEFTHGRKKALVRLKTLPLDIQLYIYGKYYGKSKL